MWIPELLYRLTPKDREATLIEFKTVVQRDVATPALAINISLGTVPPDKMWVLQSSLLDTVAGATQSINDIFAGIYFPAFTQYIRTYYENVVTAAPNHRVIHSNNIMFGGAGILIPPGWRPFVQIDFSASTNANIASFEASFYEIPRGGIVS